MKKRTVLTPDAHHDHPDEAPTRNQPGTHRVDDDSEYPPMTKNITKVRLILIVLLVIVSGWSAYPWLDQYVTEKRTRAYILPLGNSYSYFVTMVGNHPDSIALMKRDGDSFKKIPQTVRLNENRFEIFCDLDLKGNNEFLIGSVLTLLKEEIQVDRSGCPEINGIRGQLQKRSFLLEGNR